MPRPIETSRIAAAVRDYLDRYEAGDPSASSLRHDDIARECQIAKRHLSRDDDAELAALKNRIQQLQRKGEGAKTKGIGKGDRPQLASPEAEAKDPDLLLDDLTKDISRRQIEVAFRLRQWLTYHEKPGEVLDSPVMLADLDNLIDSLRQSKEDLRPLIASVNRIRATHTETPDGLPIFGETPPNVN